MTPFLRSSIRRLQQTVPRNLTPSVSRRAASSSPPSAPDKAASTTKATTSNYNRPPAPKSRATGTQLPVLPLVVIFIAGTASFYHLAKSRDGQGSSHYVLPTHDTKKNREELYVNKPPSH